MLPINFNKINNKDVLSFEQCERLYSEIIKNLNTKDYDEMEYWQDFVLSCIEYTEIRGRWLLLTSTEKLNLDNNRTIIHNGLLVKFNMLKRLLSSKNANVQWYDFFKLDNDIEDDITNLNRKQVGDLANYIVYLYAINGR